MERVMTEPRRWTAEDYEQDAEIHAALERSALAELHSARLDTRLEADEDIQHWQKEIKYRQEAQSKCYQAAANLRRLAEVDGALARLAHGMWQPIATIPAKYTETEKPVLLWTPHTAAVAYFDNGEWYIIGARGSVIEATHWMPLPAPPCAGETKE